MKQLTNLSATAINATWVEPRGTISAVHDEPAPGFFRLISLGAGGLIIQRGADVVGIPLADLLSLAENHEPSLRPDAPAAKPAPKARVPRARLDNRPANSA